MKIFALAPFAVVCAALPVHAQDPAQVQKLFEAGQYQQVVESAGPDAPPAVLYIVGMSLQKMGDAGQAVATYRRLAERPDGDPWQLVGQSAQQLAEDQLDAALESANRAVGAAGDLPEAHFQLGLVLAKRQDWHAAAMAFDRAAELNPSLAYAHYYGGLMYYRARQPDRMANRFERFLRLAPEAPERPEVLQIMRTIRG